MLPPHTLKCARVKGTAESRTPDLLKREPKMNRINKTLVTLTIVATTGISAAGAVTLVTASPAQAWSWDRQEYLRDKGYYVPVGGRAARACTIAEDGEGSANSLSICATRLEQLDVRWKHAKPACRLGAAR
jgi:hypothetical protein